ncbi:helix-turn-helix domain-containing protein [Nocardioides solisilvae]|uniref:helix-turn-helix domain-containing protein n=1 Tax=Nocardioides solisilvae TaxID=1542435 RepID=UPI000D745B82|nr:helix-turn-helix domain-containing protein [Nocardioides solisilvae]
MTTPARSRVREELLADLPALTARVVDAVRHRIPAYDALEPAQLQEVAAIAGWGITRVLEAWATDGHLDEADLQRFRGIGAARALDGRPLPVVLRAYRVAGSEVTDLVAERAADRLDVPDALALARLWMASIDALSEALYAGHEAASRRVGADRERALADLLDDLLVGRHATPAAVRARSRELGVRLPERPVLLVAGPAVTGASTGDSAGDWTSAWADLLDALPVEPDGSPYLARSRDDITAVLLPPTAAAATREACLRLGVTAVLLADHRPGDLARAHRLALHALAAAPARARVARPVLDDADAATLAVVAGHRDADPGRLRRLVLGPLDGRAALLSGLDAFLATGSATEAAEAAGCHPQTMRYRLRRVRELTGRDPRVPWDRFVLEVAATGGAGPRVG